LVSRSTARSAVGHASGRNPRHDWFIRISLWQALHIFNYGPYHWLVAATVGLALVGVVLWGSLAGAMLPFFLRRCGLDPATASAPAVATLVDVTGLIIYFNVALFVLGGTML